MKLPEIIRAAIKIGEANGTITFDQLNGLIETGKLEPEDIESLFQALRNEGINVVEATTASPEAACSFCGKSEPDVLQMIAGAGGFICNECVQLCVGIIATQNPDWLDQHRQFLTTLPQNPRAEVLTMQPVGWVERRDWASICFPSSLHGVSECWADFGSE